MRGQGSSIGSTPPPLKKRAAGGIEVIPTVPSKSSSSGLRCSGRCPREHRSREQPDFDGTTSMPPAAHLGPPAASTGEWHRDSQTLPRATEIGSLPISVSPAFERNRKGSTEITEPFSVARHLAVAFAPVGCFLIEPGAAGLQVRRGTAPRASPPRARPRRPSLHQTSRLPIRPTRTIPSPIPPRGPGPLLS